MTRRSVIMTVLSVYIVREWKIASQRPENQTLETKRYRNSQPWTERYDQNMTPTTIGTKPAKPKKVSETKIVKGCCRKSNTTLSSFSWPSKEFGESRKIERSLLIIVV